MIRIAYVATNFATLSHTFIRREVIELRKLGLEIILFGVRPQAREMLSPEQLKLHDETIYLYPLNFSAIIFANIKLILYKPLNYARTFLSALFNEETNILQHLKLVYHFFVSSYIAFYIKQRKIRHIHAHFENVASTISMYAARLIGVSYSITIHAPGMENLHSTIGLKQKIKYAKFLCTVSNYGLSYYDKLFQISEKTFLVRCGIDTNSYRKSGNYKFPIENSKIGLLAIGRLEEKKGFIYSIEALRYLVNNTKEFKLVIIGNGPLQEMLKRKTREYDLIDKIVFKGTLPEAAVRQELEKSDICIVPSIKDSKGEMEGIPVVIMEAMAMEVPVIATRHSGIPEIVRNGETGILVPEKDPKAIFDAIMLFVNNSELRKRCIINAKKIVSEEFNIINVSKIKKKIFEDNV